MTPITLDDLLGLWGELEMEETTVVIINKALKLNRPLNITKFSLNDCTSDAERTGLCELLHYGWCRKSGEPWTYNGEYIFKDEAMERINKRLAKLQKGKTDDSQPT